MDTTDGLLDLFETLTEGGPPLSAIQRMLLITDGTVTDVLEAYAKETVCVVKLSHSFTSADGEKPVLDLGPSERVLRRSILLQGVQTGTTFLYADSVIAPDRLPADVVNDLLETNQPLGKLLAHRRIGTYREIVGVGFEPAGECAHFFGVEPTAKMLFRTYRILVGDQPVMRITEKFPVTSFRSD